MSIGVREDNNQEETASFIEQLQDLIEVSSRLEKDPRDGVVAELREQIAERLGLALTQREEPWEKICEIMGARAVCMPLGDPGGSEPFVATEGEVVEISTNIKIQVHDPEGVLEEKGNILNLLYFQFKSFILKNVRSRDFKALVKVEPGMMQIVMDPGKHKEYISVLAPRGSMPGGVYYKHVRSSTEKETKNYRGDYINGVLDSMHLRDSYYYKFNKRDVSERDISQFAACSEQQLLQIFPKLVQLAASVKDLDLDLVLKEEVQKNRAVQLFKGGGVNIVNLLTKTDSIKPDSETLSVDLPNPYLCESDIKVYNSIVEYAKELEEQKEARKDMYSELSGAVKLNYDALEMLTQLQFLLIDIDGKEHDSLRDAVKIEDLFYGLRSAVLGMAVSVDRLGFQYDRTEELGFRSYEDWAKAYFERDCVKNAYDRAYFYALWGLRGGVKGRYDAFNKMLANSKAELSGPEDVESMEELIRFLHATLISKFNGCIRLYNHDLPGDKLLVPELAGIPVFDFTDSGLNQSNFYKSLNEILSALHESDVSGISQGKDLGSNYTHAVIGNDFAEVSLKLGSHMATVVASDSQKEKHIEISFYQTKSGDGGAEFRMSYMKQVLEELGFRLDADAKILKANIRIIDEEKFYKCFADVIRFLFSTNDVDMLSSSIPVNVLKTLFMDGAINVKKCHMFINSLMSDDKPWRGWNSCVLSTNDNAVIILNVYRSMNYDIDKFKAMVRYLSKDSLNNVIDGAFDSYFRLHKSESDEDKEEAEKFLALTEELEEMLMSKS